jgi:hypothetical protein
MRLDGAGTAGRRLDRVLRLDQVGLGTLHNRDVTAMTPLRHVRA